MSPILIWDIDIDESGAEVEIEADGVRRRYRLRRNDRGGVVSYDIGEVRQLFDAWPWLSVEVKNALHRRRNGGCDAFPIEAKNFDGNGSGD